MEKERDGTDMKVDGDHKAVRRLNQNLRARMPSRFQSTNLMVSPSKMTLPFSFIAATARATSVVSKSSCLSGGIAALRYVNNAEIDMSSVDSYVEAKRNSTDEKMNCFLEINLNFPMCMKEEEN